MLVVHITFFRLNNNQNNSTGKTQKAKKATHLDAHDYQLEIQKTKNIWFSNLGLLYSFHALAKASANRLTAMFPGTLLESNPRCFPWWLSKFLHKSGRHFLKIKKKTKTSCTNILGIKISHYHATYSRK